MAKGNRETLRKDIRNALYDLVFLKEKTKGNPKAHERAQMIADNTVSHKENINELALVRLLVRLDLAHKHRHKPLPDYWKRMLEEAEKKRPVWVGEVRKEAESISEIGKSRGRALWDALTRRLKKHFRWTHKKPR